jgi:archaellum component FlaC
MIFWLDLMQQLTRSKTNMSQEDVNSINIRLSGIEQCLSKLTVAIQGDESLKIDGMKQHIDLMNSEIRDLKTDVRSLKDDRKTFKAWVAGLAAAGGFGGAIGHLFSK